VDAHETLLPWQVRLWKRHFNSDPDVIGKKLILDQQPITVIGVLL